jgi:hypothetical protein
MATAIRSSSAIICTTSIGVRWMPTNGASTNMIVPWTAATVAPPAVLPNTREIRLTGATNISRRKPNSLSHTMESAENIAVMTTLIATTPGYTNWRKLNPPVVPTRPLIP